MSLLSRIPLTLIWTLFILSGVCTLAGFLGHYGLLFDLTSHFRIPYAWIQGAALLWFAFSRQWIPVMLTAAILTINLTQLLPYYWPTPLDATAQATGLLEHNTKRIKVLNLNVNAYLRNDESVARVIRHYQPDVVTIIELTPRLYQRITPVLKQYPYQHYQLQEGPFGIGMFSRYPLEQKTVVRYRETPSLIARMLLNGEPVTLIATHPPPPLSPQMYQWRNDQLKWLARMRSRFENHIILVGDLNLTPWTRIFRDFSVALDLKDTQQGMGLQPSWPAVGIPVIPIDHCLVSKNIQVLQRQLGPQIGSDHYPVFVELAIPLTAGQPKNRR